MIPKPAHDVFLVKEAARFIIDVEDPLVLIDNTQEKVPDDQELRVEENVILFE